MVKAGPPVVGGGGCGGKNKCPLCRIEFSEVDVVGGAELERAGGNVTELAPGGGGEEGAAGLASAAAEAGGEDGGGKGEKVPPPKVAALLQR